MTLTYNAQPAFLRQASLLLRNLKNLALHLISQQDTALVNILHWLRLALCLSKMLFIPSESAESL